MSALAAFRSAASASRAARTRPLTSAAATPARSSLLMAHHQRRALWRSYSSSANGADASAKQKEGEEAKGKEAEADPCADVKKKLEAKEAEVVDVTGRLRYLQADFLNLQRNAAREKEQQRDFAITRFAGDLLETVDVLALALKSVPEEFTDAASSSSSSTEKTPAHHLRELYNGVELTHKLLLQTLFKYHVKPFDPTGDAFDPNRHEALYQAPIPGKEPGSIIECQKTGYTIKDRVLRAAQVGVAQDHQA